jgi:hypothetical protein
MFSSSGHLLDFVCIMSTESFDQIVRSGAPLERQSSSCAIARVSASLQFGHSENYLARGVKRRALDLELLVSAGASWDGQPTVSKVKRPALPWSLDISRR